LSPFRQFISNISWNIFGKSFIQVIYFALSVLITRYLGKESLGLYATILVIPAFLRLVNSLGLEMALHKVLPELQVKDPELGEGRTLLRRVILLRLVTSLVLGLALFLGLPLYAEWMDLPVLVEYRGAILLYFWVVTFNSLLGAVFMTYLDYRTVTLGEGLNAVLNLLFLAWFIQRDHFIHGVLYAYILASSVNLVYYGFKSRSYIAGSTRPTDFGEMRGLAGTLYLVSLISFGLLVQTDIVFMNYFRVPSAQIGYYHLATGLGTMLTFILMGLGPLALSLFSNAYAREGADGLSRTWVLIAGFTVFLTAPIYAFAVVQAEPLVTLIYGEAFAEVGGLFALYVVFLAGQLCLGTELNGWALVTAGRKSQVLRFSVEASLLNILLDLFWIPRWAEWGAVSATGAALVYLTFRQWWAVRGVIRTHRLFPWVGKFVSLSLLALIPAMVAGLLGFDHLGWSAGIYGVTFVLMLAVVKPLSREHRQFLDELYPPLVFCFRWFSR